MIADTNIVNKIKHTVGVDCFK